MPTRDEKGNVDFGTPYRPSWYGSTEGYQNTLMSARIWDEKDCKIVLRYLERYLKELENDSTS